MNISLDLDAEEVLDQLDMDEIIKFLIENYAEVEVLDEIDDATLNEYIWTSFDDRPPFEGAIVYCIYLDENNEDQVCKAKFITGAFHDIKTMTPIKRVIRWTYQPYFD